MRIKSDNQNILFSLIASLILRCNHFNIGIILTINFNPEFHCWILQQTLLNGLNNGTSWALQQSNTSNNQSFQQCDQKDRLEMMFWSVCDSVKRESPRFRHSLVTRHCSRCDVTTWRRLQLSLPGWLMREVLLRRLSCRGPWHRFFQAPFLITVRILHSVSASSLTVPLARSCVSFDR